LAFMQIVSPPNTFTTVTRLRELRPALLFAVAVAFAIAPQSSLFAQATAPVLKPVAALGVSGQLKGKKGKVAKDISGMACDTGAGPQKRCLLVNDENAEAQFLTLSKGVIEAGRLVRLIGDKPAADAKGTRPHITCGKTGEFAEFDGEGVAFDGQHFYVTGSHGCSRNSNQFRLSSFYIARLRATGDSAASVDLTYRFSDVLMAAVQVAPFFGKPLDAKGNGLNIEGIAISGGKVWAGLRAPVLDGKAYLVGAPLAALFAPGSARWQGTAETRALPLGASRGIRDLAALPDGRLLLLSGPAQDQDIDYRVHVVDLKAATPPRLLGALAPVKDGKAEVITLMGASGGTIEFAVLYDSIENGGGQIYRVPLN